MQAAIPVYLEVGSKRTFACSLEWPGWARSGKNDESALAALCEYAPRYSEVAKAARQRFPAVTPGGIEVVERIPGNGTTDFGAPAIAAEADYTPLDRAAAGRLAQLLGASWHYLDGVVSSAPLTLRKGPRGGGRDRDEVFRHVLGAEAAYARSIGLKLKAPAVGDQEAVERSREAILEAVEAAASGDQVPVKKGWPIPYAVRRMAWHVLDHAWEIQDKS